MLSWSSVRFTGKNNTLIQWLLHNHVHSDGVFDEPVYPFIDLKFDVFKGLIIEDLVLTTTIIYLLKYILPSLGKIFGKH